MDVMKELNALSIRKPLSEGALRVGPELSEAEVHNLKTYGCVHPQYMDPGEDDGQFDEEGFCSFCGDHESKNYHYKCWR